jgi:transposase
MSNERQKQTYYGALNLATQTFWLEGYEKGNSESTLAFLESLQAQHPGCRIAVIWDGASHHRSQAIKDYLVQVNQDLEESSWKLTCLRFAPNDPQQNPVEDVWLQAKRFIREFYHLCKSFRTVKRLFEFATHCQIFSFPKVFMYGSFSRII